MTRALANCREMIFIPYTVPADAEARGYAPWLREIDNPFFNSVAGVHHYSNWKISGDAPFGWDWFDFMGVSADRPLKETWQDEALDTFRKGWLKLWGYVAEGAPTPPAMRYSYLFERVHADATPVTGATPIRFGRGPEPEGAAQLWRLKGYLPKHFAADASDGDWLLDRVEGDPLGFDWIALGLAGDSTPSELVAAPDLVPDPAADPARVSS